MAYYFHGLFFYSRIILNIEKYLSIFDTFLLTNDNNRCILHLDSGKINILN